MVQLRPDQTKTRLEQAAADAKMFEEMQRVSNRLRREGEITSPSAYARRNPKPIR